MIQDIIRYKEYKFVGSLHLDQRQGSQQATLSAKHGRHGSQWSKPPCCVLYNGPLLGLNHKCARWAPKYLARTGLLAKGTSSWFVPVIKPARLELKTLLVRRCTRQSVSWGDLPESSWWGDAPDNQSEEEIYQTVTLMRSSTRHSDWWDLPDTQANEIYQTRRLMMRSTRHSDWWDLPDN